jgi:hypothetical protein
MSYVDTICIGCGEPGRFKQSCDKKALCFIYKATNHPVEGCPIIKRPPQVAKYIGSAANGLGFFHIAVPDASETAWLNFSNCGIINVRSGSISLVALEAKLSEFFCKVKKMAVAN